MVGQNQTFTEGASINRPPLFTGENYPFWKVRMQIFLESVDRGIWDAVLNGPFVPVNIISSALTLDEFYKISVCTSAQDMWEILCVTHEGTDDVKRARKNSLIQEYEMFRMQQGETIYDMEKRFTHIVNHLTSLGKT